MTPWPTLWLCADLGELPPSELLERVTQVLATGPVVVWLRAPSETPARTLAAWSESALARLTGTSRLLVGDRVDVALAVGAHGVHLTERSLTPRDVRRVAGAAGRADLLVSQAVHDRDGVARARGAVDALVLSPFAGVEGKGPALGEHAWAALREQAPDVFVVALGGLTDARSVTEATRAGADAVAVRRALSRSLDAAAACAALRPPMP